MGFLEILKGAGHSEISFESCMVNLKIQSRKEVSKVSKKKHATCGRWETDLRRCNRHKQMRILGNPTFLQASKSMQFFFE